MFTFNSRVLNERMLVCFTENLPEDDFCIITTFSDDNYYDGKEVVLATFDNPNLENLPDEEITLLNPDPVSAYMHQGFMHKLAFEYMYILVSNILTEIIDGQDWSGINIKEIFDNRDTAWDPIREVWEHAASEVKAKLITILER